MGYTSTDIAQRIAEIEQRLKVLDSEREQLTSELDTLRDLVELHNKQNASQPSFPDASVTNNSTPEEKIALTGQLGMNDHNLGAFMR